MEVMRRNTVKAWKYTKWAHSVHLVLMSCFSWIRKHRNNTKRINVSKNVFEIVQLAFQSFVTNNANVADVENGVSVAES
jgi:hypothetical protein